LKEILIHTNLKEDTIQNMTCKDIVNYLGFNEKDTFYINYKNTNKIGYQETLFEKIFTNQKNIFDITNLHKYNWARLSLTNLFEYIKNHQENLIISLKLPTQFVNENFLYLGNHALEQLDVLPNNSTNKSLFDIINCTKTLIGKRFLKNQLCKPLVDVNELNNRFNLIEKLLKNNSCFELQVLLEDICDIERLIRRLEISVLHPYELNLLYLSFYQIKKIVLFNNTKNIFEIEKSTNEIDNFLNYVTKTFDLNKIAELNFSNFNEFEDNIFKNNEEVLKLYEKIETSKTFMIKLQEKLSEFVEEKKNKDQTLINLKFNDRDGHHFLITNRRCDNLKIKLKEINEVEIEGFTLNVNELIFTPQPKSSYTKISCKKIKEFSSSVVEYKIQLAKLTKKHFELELKNIVNNFCDILLYFCKKIAFIDFINAGAVSSIKNHYIKPIISNIKPYIDRLKSSISKLGLNNKFKKEDIAKLGLFTFMSYGWVSNVSYITCLIISWIIHGKEYGLSPYDLKPE
jgi:DNA mismatch repair protein MutS